MTNEIIYLRDIKIETKMIAISFWCMIYEN